MQRIHIKNFDIDKSLELTEQTFLLQGEQKIQQKELRKHRKNTRQRNVGQSYNIRQVSQLKPCYNKSIGKQNINRRTKNEILHPLCKW